MHPAGPDPNPLDQGSSAVSRSNAGALRRRRILLLARRQFLEHGYAGTSMSRIARELGGSKTTLWSYFPSKAALFAATLEGAIVTLGERQRDMIERSGGDLRKLAIGLHAVRTDPEAVALFRLAVGDARHAPTCIERELQVPARAAVARLMVRAMATAQLCRADPEQAARELLALVSPSPFSATPALHAPNAQSDPYIDAAINMFFRAYAIP